ncbi:MAG: peptidylprolyl isomerase [Candidatus Pacearchaeota archaeon]|nr:peptidylprolyl isomerase [Candidatus Pacearchaeota archaeon]
MVLEHNDFIEIEFTGKIKDGEIFDSNIPKDIEQAKLKLEAKPFIFSLGQGMFLKGIDDFLIGKEIGEYQIELQPKDAFGERDPKAVQIIPMKIFHQQKINPYPGAVFNFDGKIAKIISVSGGRVMTDFNNPIAGKIVNYKINIKRKLEDQNEKIKSFINFLFKQDFDFETKDKKLIIKTPKQFKPIVEMFKDKFKEIFNLDLEAKEIKDKPSKKKE